MLDFLGIGAQKAATTWIYQQLSRHPQISFPAGKEVHFWDQHRCNGAGWWLGLFADDRQGQKQGEITPAYATLDPATIREIAALLPDLRVFYSLRNPIARAWSSALMALERAEMTIDEASHVWFIDHFKLNVDYRVIAMDGWGPSSAPGFGWPAERIWINPSPNAANLNMARAYAGTVMLRFSLSPLILSF